MECFGGERSFTDAECDTLRRFRQLIGSGTQCAPGRLVLLGSGDCQPLAALRLTTKCRISRFSDASRLRDKRLAVSLGSGHVRTTIGIIVARSTIDRIEWGGGKFEKNLVLSIPFPA